MCLKMRHRRDGHGEPVDFVVMCCSAQACGSPRGREVERTVRLGTPTPFRSPTGLETKQSSLTGSGRLRCALPGIVNVHGRGCQANRRASTARGSGNVPVRGELCAATGPPGPVGHAPIDLLARRRLHVGVTALRQAVSQPASMGDPADERGSVCGARRSGLLLPPATSRPGTCLRLRLAVGAVYSGAVRGRASAGRGVMPRRAGCVRRWARRTCRCGCWRWRIARRRGGGVCTTATVRRTTSPFASTPRGTSRSASSSFPPQSDKSAAAASIFCRPADRRGRPEPRRRAAPHGRHSESPLAPSP